MDQERARLQSVESQLTAERERGARAERILKDDLFRDAMQAIRDHAVKCFREADPLDDRALLLAKVRYVVAEEFLNNLATHMQTGQMAVTSLPDVQRQLAQLKGRRAA